MINIIAVALATIMIPTSPANNILPENYTPIVEPTIYVKPTSIKTPNGTNVDIIYKEDGDLAELHNQDASFADYFSYVDRKAGEEFDSDSYIELKTECTWTYNNYAYAFYMYWGGDIKCVIEDPMAFIDDKSFVEVSTPQPDDIVCYFNGNNLLHAGIIKRVLKESVNKDPGSNLVVESKWYPSGIFRHRGDLCPYIYKYSDVFFNAEGADRVEYYRKHEKHNFVAVKGSADKTNKTHTAKCSECGYTKEENHSYTYKYLSDKEHTATCACGVSETGTHTWKTYKPGILSLSENTAEPNALTGSFVRCIFCNYLKKLGNGEFVPIIKHDKIDEEYLSALLSRKN